MGTATWGGGRDRGDGSTSPGHRDCRGPGSWRRSGASSPEPPALRIDSRGYKPPGLWLPLGEPRGSQTPSLDASGILRLLASRPEFSIEPSG